MIHHYKPVKRTYARISIPFLILTIGLLGASVAVAKNSGSDRISPDSMRERTQEIQNVLHVLGDRGIATGDPCGLNSVVCPEEKPKVVKTFQAIRTYYTRKSSCHNPKGNKCLTANGEDTTEGRTVACPYSLKLGTRVTLSDEPDHVYTCTDRYARFLDGKRGLPTVDVFVEDAHAGTVPAHKIVTVTVL